MRATLRRSCDACAKSKHSCDLRTPRCSRCIKRNSKCAYANEPLTSATDARGSPERPQQGAPIAKDHKEISSLASRNEIAPVSLAEGPAWLLSPSNASIDPFDSHPPTRLPRVRVQRLIYHFLSSIAFQYYPLDLSMESNPFVVSWWPLALTDPALFHVSLQTASLDEEVRAQKGFPISEILMADSVSLLRRKIEDSSSAFQDATLDSVVTLAAIEHGKGNVESSRMHIDGIKRIIDVRGGIGQIRCTSPLTARMVSWVSLLVTEAPQFETQDDSGGGSGIPPILQWQLAAKGSNILRLTLDGIDIDPAIGDILVRLRNIFHQPELLHLTSTELHDLTCFVMHKLLLLSPLSPENSKRSAISECIRYAMTLYMLILHGTTYYSHVAFSHTLILQLKHHLERWARADSTCNPLGIWLVSIGTASAIDASDRRWFMDHACTATSALGLRTWEDVLSCLQSILWMTSPQQELFRQIWNEILTTPAIDVQ